MNEHNIRLIISDFDGTLVNTFYANYYAYKQAFESVGLTLSENKYHDCFGLRFDEFMKACDITDKDIQATIKQNKVLFYPNYFDSLKINTPLVSFISLYKQLNGKVALASTASKENLIKALRHFNIETIFDLIISGEDVSMGKPSPEIYHKIMKTFNISPINTLIFEDSNVGIVAAKASGANYIRIKII